MQNKNKMAEQAQRARAEAAKAQAMEATETRLRSLGSRTSSYTDSSRDIMTRMLITGVPAHLAMGHPLMTAAAAGIGAVAPHVPTIAAKYAHNTVFQNPTTKDILNALMAAQGREQ